MRCSAMATMSCSASSFTGALAVGESYDASEELLLPPGFYGRYTLFVQIDAKGEVFENGADDNRGFLAGTFDVSPIPWADLHVPAVEVSAPAGGALSGSLIDVNRSEERRVGKRVCQHV